MDWSKHTAVIIASGPSLTDEQVQHVRGVEATRVMTINATYQKAPWADVFYAGDFLFLKRHIERMRKAASKHTKIWTQDGAAQERFGVNRIKGVNREGLGLDCVHTGGNSGAQGVNLAFLWGAKRILLLGFDMQLGPNGEKHWHGDHEKDLVQALLPSEWIHKFEKMAKDLKTRGVTVVNCTPGSALPWFPMSTIEEELK